MKARARWIVLLAAMACGGDDPTGGGSADRVIVSPATFSIGRSQTRQLEVAAYGADGRPLEGIGATWSSDAPDIASVNAEGIVTGIASGATRIVATVGGQQGASLVSVTEGSGAIVDVLPSVSYQTMTGWEATAQAGELECNRQAFDIYKNQLFDRAANELGVNRLRLEVRSGIENPVDWFTRYVNGEINYQEWKSHWWDIQNDNASASNAAANGFHWAFLDHTIDNVVQPMRQRLAARGERLLVTLTYVDFGASSFEHSADPAEYAELMLATFRHIDQKYGWTPDAIEMILEPDNTQNWRPETIGRAMVAAGDRLAGAGYRPAFIAPSNTSMSAAASYFDAMLGVPRVREYLTDLAYHRYSGVSGEVLAGIGQRAIQHGIRTAMLEHIGSGIDALLEDLVSGRASTWQQFTLAFCAGSDDGAQYYLVDQRNPASPGLVLTERTKYLRHVFFYVRAGAQRIGAVSGVERLVPVAFRNANGKQVVVVHVRSGGDFSVRGLTAGLYGINVSTGGSQWVDGEDQTIVGGGTVNVSMPSEGVVTIFRR
jgi:hypothetical protein